MKTVEEIREAVKRLRNGETVDGYVYTKSAEDGREYVHVDDNDRTYVARGTFRISIEEMGGSLRPMEGNAPDETAEAPSKPEKAPKPKADRPRDADGNVVKTENVKCSKCGKDFTKSIYHKTDLCPECRPAKRRRAGFPARDRVLKCAVCGKEFPVSRFHPYVTEETGCPECRKARKK